MPPRWIRRMAALAVIAFGSLVFASNAKPDACADVWTIEHHESSCCRWSAYTRITKPGGDCCDYGVVEDRDPSGTSAPLTVAPAGWVRVGEPLELVEPLEARVAYGDALIPERPPDRALRCTVLLI